MKKNSKHLHRLFVLAALAAMILIPARSWADAGVTTPVAMTAPTASASPEDTYSTIKAGNMLASVCIPVSASTSKAHRLLFLIENPGARYLSTLYPS